VSASVEAATIRRRHPAWLKVRAPGSSGYLETRDLVRRLRLHTVCEEAACPNIGECWAQRHATMMIMGDTCTRACAFCNVATGLPGPLDPKEPENVAAAVAKLALDHVVITSVDRDDLDDGGAEHFARTIRAIRARTPATTIEVLTPDFLRKDGAVETVVEARPDIYNHNLETVPGLYLKIRPGARYFASLNACAEMVARVEEVSMDNEYKLVVVVEFQKNGEKLKGQKREYVAKSPKDAERVWDNMKDYLTVDFPDS